MGENGEISGRRNGQSRITNDGTIMDDTMNDDPQDDDVKQDEPAADEAVDDTEDTPAEQGTEVVGDEDE